MFYEGLYKNFWGCRYRGGNGNRSAGCGGISAIPEDSYTFRFKVDNDTNLNGGIPKTIKKVEFINGDRQNDDLLHRTDETIGPGTGRSPEYRVSGFTVESDNSTRKCGVKVTFEDDTTVFGTDVFGHGNKILVTVKYSYYYMYPEYYISFSLGSW
jgi:hypothetical protein